MTGCSKSKSNGTLLRSLKLQKGDYILEVLAIFSPEGDFDFNVVIRSLLYNKEKLPICHALLVVP